MQDKLKLLKEFLTWRNFNLGEKILFIYLMSFFIIHFIALNIMPYDFFEKYFIILAIPMLLFYLTSLIIMMFYVIYKIYIWEIILFVLIETMFYKIKTNDYNHFMRLFFCVIFQIISYIIYTYIRIEKPFSQTAYVTYYLDYIEFSIMIILTNPFTLHRIIHMKEESSNASQSKN